jgi:16S rRNA (adenine1518-N6/adenine1519-N6)-dimethyltransferase
MKKRRKQRRPSRGEIDPNKDLGQHFLIDRKVLQREVFYAELRDTDRVLEVGPGTGNLTELLLKKAGHVVVIERDKRFAEHLNRLQERYTNLEVRWGNANTMAFPPFDKFVSNLPYRLALPIIFKVLGCDFRLAVVVCQESMADRICAGVGESGYCRLSVCVQRLADTLRQETVPRSAFDPPPAVESAVVTLNKTRPKFSVPSEEFFRTVLDGLFAHRYESTEEAVVQLKGKGLDRKVLERAVGTLSKKTRRKEVCRVAPREFGIIARALSDSIRAS